MVTAKILRIYGQAATGMDLFGVVLKAELKLHGAVKDEFKTTNNYDANLIRRMTARVLITNELLVIDVPHGVWMLLLIEVFDCDLGHGADA